MPLMLPAQALLEPVDDASGVELPRHFADSLEHLRAAISRCDQVGCFPQFYAALAPSAPDFAITL